MPNGVSTRSATRTANSSGAAALAAIIPEQESARTANRSARTANAATTPRTGKKSDVPRKSDAMRYSSSQEQHEPKRSPPGATTRSRSKRAVPEIRPCPWSPSRCPPAASYLRPFPSMLKRKRGAAASPRVAISTGRRPLTRRHLFSPHSRHRRNGFLAGGACVLRSSKGLRMDAQKTMDHGAEPVPEIPDIACCSRHQSFCRHQSCTRFPTTISKKSCAARWKRSAARLLFKMKVGADDEAHHAAAAAVGLGEGRQFLLLTLPTHGGHLKVETTSRSNSPLARIAESYAGLMDVLKAAA